MSTRKLLISAAAAALMAGSAAALGVTQGDAQLGTPSAGTSIVGTPITGALVVAEEASFADAGSDFGVFELDIEATGTFAASENYFVDISVSGGTFSDDLTGAEVTDGDAGGITISGSSVQIAGQAQTGQEGENAVRFLVSNSPTVGDNFGIELPIQYSGCPASLNFTISIQTSGGVTFEEGTVALAAPAITCGNAYQATITSDVTVPANDSLLASTAFESFVTGTTTNSTNADLTGPNLQGPDTGTLGTFGTLTVEFDPDSVGPVFVTELNNGANALSTISGGAGDVDTATFDVNVSNPAGLDEASLTEDPGANGPDTFSVAGVASLTADMQYAMSGGDIIDNIDLSVLTGASSVQVAQQDVTTTNGLLNFLDVHLVDDEPIADATLDDLNYEGETCGTFDWVGDSTKPTQNIFRVTGAGPTTSDVIATLSNSSNGTSFDGSYTLTTAFDFSGNEVIINANHLTTDAGEFGRADVLLNFIGASTALDCDRLMNSDASNIITPFGNRTQTVTLPGGVTDGDDD